MMDAFNANFNVLNIVLFVTLVFVQNVMNKMDGIWKTIFVKLNVMME